MKNNIQYANDLFRRQRVKYVKSPLNYAGGKYKLLPQIIPLLPYRIDTFADLFMGGCNVAANVSAKRYYCNDLNTPIVNLFQVFRSMGAEEVISRVDANIAKYNLSKQNEDGFLALRNHYNATRDAVDLYTLTCYSFNYQFRFNSHLEYNNPFGRDRSHFSERMRKNLDLFVARLQKMNIELVSHDFIDISLDLFSPTDFIYCDPPNLLSGNYSGSRGFQDWREANEISLYDYLDRADARGLRFALSNVLSNRTTVNNILLRWSKKYRIIDLCPEYSEQALSRDNNVSREILVVNYGVDNGNFINTGMFGRTTFP